MKEERGFQYEAESGIHSAELTGHWDVFRFGGTLVVSFSKAKRRQSFQETGKKLNRTKQ